MTLTPITELTDEHLTLALARHLYPEERYWYVEDYDWAECDNEDAKCFRFQICWEACGPLWQRDADDYEQYLYNRQSDDEIVTNAKIDAIKNKVIESSKTPAGIARAILSMKYPDGIDLGGGDHDENDLLDDSAEADWINHGNSSGMAGDD